MKFGPVPTKDALGAILAHSLPVAKTRLRKGHKLDASDLIALGAAGHDPIVVAQLEPGDLDENAAAATLAQAVAGQGLHLSTASTGRVNLFAAHAGIVGVDAAAIHALNAVNPMMTLATLQPFQRVAKGAMVATIKIISYAVPEADINTAARIGAAALHVLPAVFSTATLIETQIGPVPGGKGHKALALRLARLGVTLTPRVIVPHQGPALAAAIAQAAGEVVFILTASATSDRDDVGPAAVRTSGGVVTQFGMPVDPGNLLFLGYKGRQPIVGLPGCARSAALNGADWVLERVICGVPLGPADFAAMGVGGLLKEIPSRPKPRSDI